MNKDDGVYVDGQGVQVPAAPVPLMATNEDMQKIGVSDTSGFASTKIKSMLSEPGFRSGDAFITEDEINKRMDVGRDPYWDMDTGRTSFADLEFKSSVPQIVKDEVVKFGMGIQNLGDKARVALGGITALATNNKIGAEMRDRAYDTLESATRRMSLENTNAADAETLTAQVTQGASSMLEMIATGLVTGGIAPLAQMGVEAMGDGTYNNMIKYAKEHDGSIEGYQGNWLETGIDLANAVVQVGIERYLGVGSNRFLRGTGGHFLKEAVEGFAQESSQDFLTDLSEYLKDNGDAPTNWEQYMISGVIGGLLQGTLGAATYKYSRTQADNELSNLIFKASKARHPEKDDATLYKESRQQAKAFNDDVEAGIVKNSWDELANRVDANNDRGKVRDNLVSELTKARVAALGLESADELDADDLADIQDAATVAAGEAFRESFIEGKPIEQTLTARLVADGKDLVVRDLTPEERGVREISRVDLQADEDALAQQIGTARESLARARLETELQAQQTALEEERARRKADVEELQAWAEQQVRLGEEIGRRRERGQTEFSLREINRWLRQSSRSEQARAREERKAGQVRERKKEIAQKPLPKESTPETEPTKVKPEQQYLLQQSLKNVAKGVLSDTGRGAYNSRYQRIILNKDSDVSTILHELSHMWLNNWFKAYRAENAPESFRKWWRPVERALGIRESDRFLDQDASEKFARSFEKWVLDGGKGAESSLAPVYERLSKRLADIYDDLATRYFDMVADLKPEVQSWFAKNEALADSMVVDVPEHNEETGETTTEQVRVQYRDRAAERETAQKMAETEEKAERTADRAADEINEITENVGGEQLAPDSDEPAQSPYTAEGQREQRTSQRIKDEASAEGVLIEARKYDPLMAKRAAEDAVIFATTDLDSAFEVAMGRKNAPGDVPRIAVFFAVKNRLMLNPAENVARLQELAKDSPVITELSEAGKKLRMAGVAMSKDDPLRILRDLSKMYDENLTAEERAKITENINQINEYINRADLDYEDTWNKILSDMECK